MNQRSLLSLAAAVLLGGVAVVGVRGLISQPIQPISAEVPAMGTLVVARTALAFGDRLTPENITTIPWPSQNTPAGSFRTPDQLLGGGAARVVLRSLEPNEPILEGKISGPDGRGTLSVTIAEGMRALSIRVNDVLGVAGFVLPGDRVDILLTRTQQEQGRTDTLLQNVRVLGIDQNANDRVEGAHVARAVTLEVTPDQAQRLTLAASVGTLVLSLRNQLQADMAETRPVTVGDLVAQKAPEKPDAPPVRPRATENTVRVIRGTKADTVRVP